MALGPPRFTLGRASAASDVYKRQGYAFVPEAWGGGYAREAASVILASAWQDFGMTRVLAITNEHNDPSQRLLLTLGFVEEAPRVLQEGSPPVRTFAKDRPAD